MVTISPQLEENSKQVVEKNNLTFPVLSDTENKVAKSFGLVFELPEDLKQVYSKFGIDLEKFNGTDSWTLPMPGTFIINKDGTILSAEAFTDHSQRPDPEKIIKTLKSL
jgi:peroxiredoxin